MPFNNLYKRIVKLQEFDLESEIIKIINSNSEFLSNLLAIQLSEGKDADNEPVLAKYGPFYSRSTVFAKERFGGSGLGGVTDRITNYMSGSFYHGLRVTASANNFVFSSDVPYFQDIIIRSKTHRVVELNAENLSIFRQEILLPQLKISFNNGL